MVDPSSRRVLVPGGTGVIGGAVVRALLSAGDRVVVATRSAGRGAKLRTDLASAGGRLEVVVDDYSTFDGAARTVEAALVPFGGIDDVFAPVGDLWSGRPLQDIEVNDWTSAFVVLATTHMAIARAALPHLPARGSYTITVGESAERPVPGLGLVSMQQAAALMMQRVLAAEAGDARRVLTLVLGQVATPANPGPDSALGADQVGAIAAALIAGQQPSDTFHLADRGAAEALLGRPYGLDDTGIDRSTISSAD